jgi:hypothetical protein
MPLLPQRAIENRARIRSDCLRVPVFENTERS